MKDLFGNTIEKDVLLTDYFIEPPFSVLDTTSRRWQKRKLQWMDKGIKSEVGRSEDLTYKGNIKSFDYYRVKKGKVKQSKQQGTSVFDPVLTELMYKWFCTEYGKILDPFAGGSVRGIVANYRGYDYCGIELRKEQVESNQSQSQNILSEDNQPLWIQGDSNKILDQLPSIEYYDFVFSCPPYMNLEKYSDLPDDISNMNDENFTKNYNEIIKKACERLKKNRFACFVVGDIRDQQGYYKDFITLTKKAFFEADLKLYNDMILLNFIASASMRAKNSMKNRKVCKIHQNILVFYKGDSEKIQNNFKDLI